jgi:hypothetical protein
MSATVLIVREGYDTKLLSFERLCPTALLVTTAERTTEDSTRGRGACGVSIGIETTRTYEAEDVPSGSQRSVERVLKTLLDRTEIARIWMAPIGEKEPIWDHPGPLKTLPNLDALFAADKVTTEGSVQLAA